MTLELALEYLKVLLSAPVMSAGAALGIALLFRESLQSLFNRVASLKVAGIGELQTSQSSRAEAPGSGGKDDPEPLPAEGQSTAPLPAGPTDPQLLQKLMAERERAYLWEYRYLNLFLVRGTQLVLDWFAGRAGPTTFAVYDNWWSSIVVDPQERFARVGVLKSHYLLIESNGLLTVSEKGREYLEWRGALPSSQDR